MIINRSGELSPLEILVLTFVKSGLTAPYDLISQAGMSVGVSSPALKRLEQDGLLNPTPGPRNRTDYSLTDKGETKLRDSLKALQKDSRQWLRIGRFDSASRVILLLWIYFGFDEALACVHRAAEEFRVQGRKREVEAEGLREDMVRMEQRGPTLPPPDLFEADPPSTRGPLLAVSVRWMKTSADAALLYKEAEMMENMGELLSRLPSSLQLRVENTEG